jgi:hypothetical protein
LEINIRKDKMKFKDRVKQYIREEENIPSEKALRAWVKKHPNPEDEVLHKWVEKNGWDIHEVEDMMYKIVTSHIKERG